MQSPEDPRVAISFRLIRSFSLLRRVVFQVPPPEPLGCDIVQCYCPPVHRPRQGVVVGSMGKFGCDSPLKSGVACACSVVNEREVED